MNRLYPVCNRNINEFINLLKTVFGQQKKNKYDDFSKTAVKFTQTHTTICICVQDFSTIPKSL